MCGGAPYPTRKGKSSSKGVLRVGRSTLGARERFTRYRYLHLKKTGRLLDNAGGDQGLVVLASTYRAYVRSDGSHVEILPHNLED